MSMCKQCTYTRNVSKADISETDTIIFMTGNAALANLHSDNLDSPSFDSNFLPFLLSNSELMKIRLLIQIDKKYINYLSFSFVN